MAAAASPKALSKNLSPKQRLEALKALVRFKGDEKKRHNGRVSEAQTGLKKLALGEIPETHAACVQRLKDIQARWKEVDDKKKDRTNFNRVQEEAEYQILFEDIREGTQVELPGTEVVITLDSLQHLKRATTAVKTADAERDDAEPAEGEDAPKLPPPADAKVLADLDAALDGFIAEAKIAPAALPTDAQAVHPDDAKPGRKPAANAAPPVH